MNNAKLVVTESRARPYLQQPPAQHEQVQLKQRKKDVMAALAENNAQVRRVQEEKVRVGRKHLCIMAIIPACVLIVLGVQFASNSRKNSRACVKSASTVNCWTFKAAGWQNIYYLVHALGATTVYVYT